MHVCDLRRGLGTQHPFNQDALQAGVLDLGVEERGLLSDKHSQ